MKRNKINSGWSAIPTNKKRKKFTRNKVSWITKYESHISFEETMFEKIIKFMIKISLSLTISKKNLLNSRKKAEIIDTTYDSLSSDKFAFIPAGIGLYFFLSFIPIIIISISLIKLFPGWGDLLLNDVLSNIIPGINQMFSTIKFDSTAINIAFIFFLVSLIWFASKGISKFNDSFTSIYDYEFNTNWIVKRFKGILIVIFISLFFTLIGITYLPLLEVIKFTFQSINKSTYEFMFFLSLTIYLFIFGYLGIGFLFIFIPPFKLKWKQIKPGILTTLFPTILFIILFGVLSKYLNYEKFGTIGTFIYSLIFVLYLSYFLHAGIIINSSYYKIYFSSIMVRKKIIISKKFFLLLDSIWNNIKKLIR